MILQLDSKDDIVDIDAHVELSRKDQWLFVLKRDTFLRPGDAQKQVRTVRYNYFLLPHDRYAAMSRLLVHA
jgi:hypothetical protein